MKQGRNTVIIAILATVTLFANGQTGGNEQGAAARRDYEVHDIGVLDALIQLGQLYDQPMGIVCGDKKIASIRVSVQAPGATAQEAMALLIRQLPGYKWSEDKSLILVRPRLVAPITKRILHAVIRSIAAKNMDVDALS